MVIVYFLMLVLGGITHGGEVGHLEMVVNLNNVSLGLVIVPFLPCAHNVRVDVGAVSGEVI